LQQVGRYVVEREIARGAMGVVYRARDPSVDRAIALKRLLTESPLQVQMFEREYHTLRSLRHPRIIEVFDYGVAEDGAYYTMELLDGADLREIAPLAFDRTCAYLRDVASSLSLLHARRMIHRDLSPRNVRVTGDDRAKLIDFGALSSFGVPDVVVGTPPCVPPEALRRSELDQRADLYALGALAYWLLTGRHAYPARELSELPEAWRKTPPRPSEVVKTLGLSVPAIPPDLDALVMALLTLNPLGRPASAAEVIDRLEHVGDLARDRDEGATRSYLLGVVTVGRDHERERLRRRLASALAGAGSSIVLEGQSGMGSTRLLGELIVEAQLGGALPVMLDANVERGAYGVVHALIAQLLESAPREAVAAIADQRAILARFSPALARALGAEPDATDFSVWPGELRKRTQAALAEWLFALARNKPLILAVDNAQRMDDASATLLTALASAAAERGLLIVAALKPGEEASATAPAAVRALTAMSTRIELRGLRADSVHALVRLLFGDVQNTGRLADWMHRLSAGNPRACMELAAELVDRNVVRYIQGAWVLPQELPEAELPQSLDAIIAQRLQRLDAGARELAEALCVHRGALSLSSCLALAHKLGLAAPHAALQALCRESIVLVSGDRYHFAHDAVRGRVLAAVSEARRQQLHRMLGGLLATDRDEQDTNALLDAGWHLLHGGEAERGAALLADAGLRLTYASDEMSAAVPALRAALEVYRRLKRPAAEQLRLLTPLAMAAYYSDRRLADTFGDEALQLFRRHLGFELAARLRPLMGRHLSVYIAIALTGLRFMMKRELGGIRGLQQRIVDYFACCMALTGVAAICLDAPTARRRAAHLEPLTVFGRDHAAHFAHRFASILALVPEDHPAEIIERCRELLERFDETRAIRDLAPATRKMLHGGVLYALASYDAFRASSNVLEYADRLEGLGLKLYELVADQLRTNYHALRGEAEIADRYRARVELHAVQAGSAWQVEVWAPCTMIVVNVLTQDTIGLKRTIEQLDRLGQEIPTLAFHARMARSEYHFLKGEHEEGIAISRPLRATVPERGVAGYTFSLASEAHALNRLGRHAEAKALIEPVVQRLSEADKAIVGHYGNPARELAHACCGLGDHATAFAIIDELLDRHGGSGHPLLLGNLHSTGAAIAIAAGDATRALDHLARMEAAFAPTKNPALIAQGEHMRREVKRLVEQRAPDLRADLDAIDSSSNETEVPVRSLLKQCKSADQRAQLALELIVQHVRGKRGFLFALERDELQLIAPQHGAEPQTELVERIRYDIDQDLEQDDVTVVGRPARSPLPPALEVPPSRTAYRTITLGFQSGGGLRVVGAVAVECGARPLRAPQASFLQRVARALFEDGEGSSSRA
jgi:hypothetical protein